MNLIYFGQAGDGGPIKIGFTAGEPLERISALQTGCPWPIRFICAVPGEYGNEVALHNYFDAHRTYGEWFLPVPELLTLIEQAPLPGFSWSPQFEAILRPACPALQRAIELAGGGGKLGQSLKKKASAQAVSQWRRVPPLRVLDVERATGVPRHELRPDLYPPPPVSEPERVAS